MEAIRLPADEVSRIADIDRSEHVDVEYEVVDGQLVERPVTMAEIPAWDPVGTDPHSVPWHIEFCRAALADGAVLLGAVDGDRTVGLAVVDAAFEPGMAWLTWLHVGRPDRRRGAARVLWGAALDHARRAHATSLYVSATPTGSAVGFYLAQGCRLADPVHPRLFADEPDDIHLVAAVPRG